MDRAELEAAALRHLRVLCEDIPDRRVGSAGNRQATQYFADTMRRAGFDVETPQFDCLDWVDRGAQLTAGGDAFTVLSSPYSMPCDASAPLVVARTVDELAGIDAAGSILLLAGEITAEQLMPKNFPFYNPEHHQQVYALLERKAPRAIITATGRNPELAGALYPFPMIEDGDFAIPSVYMTDVDGERLARFAGHVVALRIDAERIPSTGHNVIASKQAQAGRRVVLCAHIDAKDGTPGALDNGTGVTVLLLLADLLRGYDGGLRVDLLALNGEDHYSAQGHKHYIAHNRDRFGEIVVTINTDVAGYIEGRSAYSLYGCPPAVADALRGAFGAYDSLREGEPWYQSDHSIFIQNGCPAAAVTSEHFMALSAEVTHTPQDTLSLVDAGKTADIALALRDAVTALDRAVRET